MKKIFLGAYIFWTMALAPQLAAASVSAYDKTLPPAEIKSHIDIILSAEEFQSVQHSSAWESLRQRIIDLAFKVMNHIARIWPDFELRPSRIIGPLGWAVAILAYLLGAGILGLILYVIVQVAKRRLNRTSKPLDTQAVEIARPALRNAEEALALAASLSEKGDYRHALRAVYLAALLALDARRILEYIPSRTNWENVRALGKSQAQEPLLDLTKVFDRKIYGGEECTTADYERALESYKKIANLPALEGADAARA